MENYNWLIGKTLENGRFELSKLDNDVYIYPTKIDNRNIIITANLDFRRLQIEVNNNIITKINGLG